MKKILTPILTLSTFVLLILGGVWIINRQEAKKEESQTAIYPTQSISFGELKESATMAVAVSPPASGNNITWAEAAILSYGKYEWDKVLQNPSKRVFEFAVGKSGKLELIPIVIGAAEWTYQEVTNQNLLIVTENHAGQYEYRLLTNPRPEHRPSPTHTLSPAQLKVIHGQ